MKTLVFTLLLCICFSLSAQESGIFKQLEPETETVNFFALNYPHLDYLEPQKIQLKMPSIYAQENFKTQDTWIMPALDLGVPVCPTDGNLSDGFLGFQTVKSFNFFRTRVTSTYTFDATGNLRSSEITFGGF